MYLLKKYKTYHLAIFLCILFLILKLYVSTQDLSRFIEISCHYSTQNDALLSVEDPRFSPGDKPIFFHETSCRGGITNRQACAIESAARLHPKRQINLLFSAPINESALNNSNLVYLLQIKNIKIFRLHVEKYAQGTIAESIFRSQIKESSYPVEHMADLLRIVTLNKFGGVYLDTDSILVKNLDSMPLNWIAKENRSSIASGAMGFSNDGLGHNLTSAILKELHDTYRPKSWSNNGPKAIQRVLKRICPKIISKNMDCKGLKIFPPKDFYPVHYSCCWQYFNNRHLDNLYKSYMHHMWNSITGKQKMGKFSPFAILAEKYCPTIFGMELYDTYHSKSWSTNGPKAIHRVLERICLKAVLENGDCKGLKIFPPKDFYPVHYSYSSLNFKTGGLKNLYKPYMHHTWNSMTRNLQIEKYSPFAILAEKYCPTIFGTYGEEFGQ